MATVEIRVNILDLPIGNQQGTIAQSQILPDMQGGGTVRDLKEAANDEAFKARRVK
ncbi:MAG: hypothetical protein PHY62_00265 [Gallionella sp.]|nr:hypothetical protein [Gallionella sp.]